jgi:hypothetical protein
MTALTSHTTDSELCGDYGRYGSLSVWISARRLERPPGDILFLSPNA